MGNSGKIGTIAFVVCLALLLSSCTRNNGNIGIWFGTWQVKEMKINNNVNADYEGNVVLKFQNDIMESQAIYDHHLTNTCYARWTYDSDYLILELPETTDNETQYGYVEELQLPWLPIIEMKVLNLNGKTATLRYIDPEGNSIDYIIDKLY